MPWPAGALLLGELAGLWRAAGLRDVRPGPLVVRASHPDFEDLWSPFPTGVAPSGRSASRWATTAGLRCMTRIACAPELATVHPS